MAEPTKRPGAPRSSTGASKRAAPAKATDTTAAAPGASAPAAHPKRTTPLAASGSTWSIQYKATALVLVLAAFVLLLRLADQERGGPAHDELSIGDGIPATLYLPVHLDDGDDFPSPPPEDQRPPIVVMSHGYSVDRASMSGMARSLADAGYAVLNIDLRGHGANTHAFAGDLRDDFAAAVDWATTSPYVDGGRLAVLGHSMGAGAALDFATRDDRAKAVIPVSGGWVVNDAATPAHALFLVADGDPGRIADRQADLAADLEAAGSTVTSEEITGSDHLRILRDSDTIAAIVDFLDPIFGVDRDGPTPGLVDPRMSTAALYLVVAFGLVALLGLAFGQAVPNPAAMGSTDTGPAGRSPYLLLAGALLLAMPLLSTGGFDLLPIGAGQPIVMHLALTSALLWGGRALAVRGQLQGATGRTLAAGRWLELRTGGWAGLAAGLGIVLLLMPLAPVFHRMTPTTERAVYWVVLSALLVPFFCAVEALLRTGRTVRANARGVGGKVLLLVALGVGLRMGALPFVISLILPLLLLQYVLLEVFAGTAYARGRNTTLIGIANAVVIGFMVVTLTPVG